MAQIKLILIVCILFFIVGCSEENMKPDSLSIGFVHERVRSTGDDWKGYTIGATWELK